VGGTIGVNRVTSLGPYVSMNFSNIIVSLPNWIMVLLPIFLHAILREPKLNMFDPADCRDTRDLQDTGL
jgi:hypothetical protein